MYKADGGRSLETSRSAPANLPLQIHCRDSQGLRIVSHTIDNMDPQIPTERLHSADAEAEKVLHTLVSTDWDVLQPIIEEPKAPADLEQIGDCNSVAAILDTRLGHSISRHLSVASFSIHSLPAAVEAQPIHLYR